MNGRVDELELTLRVDDDSMNRPVSPAELPFYRIRPPTHVHTWIPPMISPCTFWKAGSCANRWSHHLVSLGPVMCVYTWVGGRTKGKEGDASQSLHPRHRTLLLLLSNAPNTSW